MSQNMTVTCLRSPSILCLSARTLSIAPSGRYFRILTSFSSAERLALLSRGVSSFPQSPQNLKRGGLGKPHLGQVASSLAPHPPQNLTFSGLSNSHSGHSILFPVETPSSGCSFPRGPSVYSTCCSGRTTGPAACLAIHFPL